MQAKKNSPSTCNEYDDPIPNHPKIVQVQAQSPSLSLSPSLSPTAQKQIVQKAKGCPREHQLRSSSCPAAGYEEEMITGVESLSTVRRTVDTEAGGQLR
jgi:hypothetical protein